MQARWSLPGQVIRGHVRTSVFQNKEETIDLLTAGPFQNNLPKPFVATKKDGTKEPKGEEPRSVVLTLCSINSVLLTLCIVNAVLLNY